VRTLVSSGSYLEPIIGFSRAVRIGPYVSVAGTAPIAAGGGTAAKGDPYGQTKRILEIILAALGEAGAGPEHVIRTRILLTGIAWFPEAARAHGEGFVAIRPASTFMVASGFVEPDWLAELEADAVVP
jgi:enamine deaminase RidA (YjgF/YER057c/UK114 family)